MIGKHWLGGISQGNWVLILVLPLNLCLILDKSLPHSEPQDSLLYTAEGTGMAYCFYDPWYTADAPFMSKPFSDIRCLEIENLVHVPS